MKAYDIAIHQRPYDRARASDCGWCFGLPPGIGTEQWPLDPDNGYPLVHAFTIALPADYRCRSPDLVAISMFGASFDMNRNGGPEVIDEIRDVLRRTDEEPRDPGLRALWRRNRNRHPGSFRLKDQLGLSYAVIFLTEEEFAGPPCDPPSIARHPSQMRLDPPRWLAGGSAAAVFEAGWSYGFNDVFDKQPDASAACNLALGVRERENDPNAGIAVSPRDTLDDPEADYRSPFFEDANRELQYHEWFERFAQSHFGGTIVPAQNLPPFSPYYVEFEERLGGFNFGGGFAQLDLKDLKMNMTR